MLVPIHHTPFIIHHTIFFILDIIFPIHHTTFSLLCNIKPCFNLLVIFNFSSTVRRSVNVHIPIINDFFFFFKLLQLYYNNNFKYKVKPSMMKSYVCFLSMQSVLFAKNFVRSIPTHGVMYSTYIM